MTSRGVKYAEEDLGVHSVYEGLITSRAKLAEMHEAINTLRASKRNSESLVADREMQLVGEHRAAHADMSQAAFDRHMKVVLQEDEQLRPAREALLSLDRTLDQATSGLKLAETDVRIGVARLEELGGYLNYLAALAANKPAKSADSAESETK